MDKQIIACFDVHYDGDRANACSIVFEIFNEKILSTVCITIDAVPEYIPGEFYRRELPCILKLYDRIEEKVDLLIVDGFVFLENHRRGLGAYLFEALGGNLPVIGVAKTYFKGCKNFLTIYRGNSKKPLYISSIGIDLKCSAEFIENLNGPYRIPDVLKKVDRLTRGA